MRLFSNKDIEGKKRLLTFKNSGGLAGILLNLKREPWAPSEITPIADCPLDQSKVWIKYIWNQRKVDTSVPGSLEVKEVNEMVISPGDGTDPNAIPYYAYPLSVEPGATYRITVNSEGQARVRARYYVDGVWLQESTTTYDLIRAQAKFTNESKEFTVPQGNDVWVAFLFSCGSGMEAKYYSVLLEKL